MDGGPPPRGGPPDGSDHHRLLQEALRHEYDDLRARGGGINVRRSRDNVLHSGSPLAWPGDAGGHVIRLLVMEHGAYFRVRRSGRLYGAPAERWVHWNGEDLTIGEEDELFPPIDGEEEGEEV